MFPEQSILQEALAPLNPVRQSIQILPGRVPYRDSYSIEFADGRKAEFDESALIEFREWLDEYRRGNRQCGLPEDLIKKLEKDCIADFVVSHIIR